GLARVCRQRPQPELHAAADLLEPLAELPRLRAQGVRKLLIVAEAAAELRGQEGATARQQLLDHPCMPEHRLARDLRRGRRRRPAEHDLELADPAALERGVVEAG